MRMINDPKRYEDVSHSKSTACEIFRHVYLVSRKLLECGRVLASLSFLFVCTVLCHAQEAPYSSSSISGLGARNIGSATMSGRISAIAGTREPSGKITLFVGAASGGVWKSDDSGTRFRPVFDEQPE